MTNEQIFKSVICGYNFMTPQTEGYFGNDELVCELSYGYGMGLYMFGCTFVNKRTREREMDLDTSFCEPNKDYARQQAMDYIKQVLN